MAERVAQLITEARVRDEANIPTVNVIDQTGSTRGLVGNSGAKPEKGLEQGFSQQSGSRLDEYLSRLM